MNQPVFASFYFIIKQEPKFDPLNYETWFGSTQLPKNMCTKVPFISKKSELDSTLANNNEQKAAANTSASNSELINEAYASSDSVDKLIDLNIAESKSKPGVRFVTPPINQTLFSKLFGILERLD